MLWIKIEAFTPAKNMKIPKEYITTPFNRDFVLLRKLTDSRDLFFFRRDKFVPITSAATEAAKESVGANSLGNLKPTHWNANVQKAALHSCQRWAIAFAPLPSRGILVG
jgi:hypothetical protein